MADTTIVAIKYAAVIAAAAVIAVVIEVSFKVGYPHTIGTVNTLVLTVELISCCITKIMIESIILNTISYFTGFP